MDALVVYLLLLASFFLFEFEKGCSADLNRLGLAVMLAGCRQQLQPSHKYPAEQGLNMGRNFLFSVKRTAKICKNLAPSST